MLFSLAKYTLRGEIKRCHCVIEIPTLRSVLPFCPTRRTLQHSECDSKYNLPSVIESEEGFPLCISTDPPAYTASRKQLPRPAWAQSPLITTEIPLTQRTPRYNPSACSSQLLPALQVRQLKAKKGTMLIKMYSDIS